MAPSHGHAARRSPLPCRPSVTSVCEPSSRPSCTGAAPGFRLRASKGAVAGAARPRPLQLLIFLVTVRRQDGAEHLGDAPPRLLARVLLACAEPRRTGASQHGELGLDAGAHLLDLLRAKAEIDLQPCRAGGRFYRRQPRRRARRRLRQCRGQAPRPGPAAGSAAPRSGP